MTRWTRIRFVGACIVVGALLAGIWLVPGVASAEKPAAAPGAIVRGSAYSDADCDALSELDDETPDVKSTSNDIYGKRAEAVSEGFAATADKVDNKKLKKALNTLSGFYDDLGDVDSVAGAVAATIRSGKKYGKAIATWTKATVSCVTSNVTIPSITLPSGVTLPSGITLPTNITIPSARR